MHHTGEWLSEGGSRQESYRLPSRPRCANRRDETSLTNLLTELTDSLAVAEQTAEWSTNYILRPPASSETWHGVADS